MPDRCILLLSLSQKVTQRSLSGVTVMIAVLLVVVFIDL